MHDKLRGLRTMMSKLFRNFGRPNFHYDIARSEAILEQADTKIEELNKTKASLEARLKLLEIQGSPRGELRA